MVDSLLDNMDYAENKGSRKQSKVEFEKIQKGDIFTNGSSSSSCASDLSQELAIDNIFNSNSALQIKVKPDVPESLGDMQISGNLSRCGTPSASKGSSQLRLSGILGCHDPNRIPVSIFSARPSNPMEWSIASTESLFSIHVGNSSFSRDHFNFLNKSGELYMGGTDFNQPPAVLPHFVEAAKVESKSEIVGNDLSQSWTPSVPQYPAFSNYNSAEHRNGALSPVEKLRSRNSISNHSDDSVNSTRSFKFPVLAGDSATTSCDTTLSKRHKPLKPSHEHQSFEVTSASPNTKMSCFACFTWCPRR